MGRETDMEQDIPPQLQARAEIEVVQSPPPNDHWYTLKPHILVGETELLPALGDMLCLDSELEEMKKAFQWIVDELNSKERRHTNT